MPKSKRARVVHTSKVTKNRKELVQRLHANVQAAVDEFNFIWVFDVQNMRNTYLKQVRHDFRDSRLLMGKTKVMVHALGATEETEYAVGLRLLAAHVSGEVGLLFTNRAPDEIRSYFSNLAEWDYARADTVASAGFTIPRGELTTAFGVEGGEDDPIPVAVEPTLRKLGVPTSIIRGKVVLEAEGDEDMQGEDGYVVCREGDVLDSGQTTLLKIFGVRLAQFRVDLKAWWEKESGQVTEVGEMDLT